MVEPQPTVLHAALGAELGDVFGGLHREHGVRLLLGDGVESLQGSGGSVSVVVTGSGERVAADLVVIGVGARPRTELAEAAGLTVDNGVVVDHSLRTEHPDVFAAGDVANAFHPLLNRHLRVEHWANALNGGPAAARSMLGQPVVYDRVPYFFTDQYDLGMEYSGSVGPDGYDQLVLRGDVAARELVVFWLKDGRVLAGMNVNVWDVTDSVQALVRSGTRVDVDRLADPGTPLEEVAAAAR
jgi:3-phenylpropionate/trans-cinnamate dioxygenase ferredoxin reductase subunit